LPEPNPTSAGLGIIRWDAFEYVVSDIERSRRFYSKSMQVPEIAILGEQHAAQRGEDAVLFSIGHAPLVCVTPRDPDSSAGRWLKRHPDGVSRLGLRVRDIEHSRRILTQRGATFCESRIQEESDHAGNRYRHFEIASPLGDVRFRFIERSDGALPPGFLPTGAAEPQNPFHFQVIDHVTSNLLTLGPFISWLRDVFGFEEFWRVHFHTQDVRGELGGSGLASIVMRDPESGIKFANNEPATPNYEASQIYRFCEANSGPGVQHVAFSVPKIQPSVDGLRRAGINFLDTPSAYFDMLPARLADRRVTNFGENIDELRSLGILVDGEDDRYLLQIFMVEGGLLYDDQRAGPFFYEVIQRCGSNGFGEGNFRALFEAIERDQVQREMAEKQIEAGVGS